MNSIRWLPLIASCLITSVVVSANGDLPRDSLLEGDGTMRRVNIPVLMYHYVSALPEDADEIRTNLTVSPEQFRDHLAYLRDNNYNTISFEQMHRALQFGEPLPPNPVILTFDDGHIDHYVTVFPLLQDFGFTGTFFIITRFADESEPAHLNWEQIREMANAGMSMEAHTKNHATLTDRDAEFLVYEILGSIESIAVHTGQTPRVLSYPVGRYDAMTLSIVETTDLIHAVTTQHGSLQTSSNRYEVPRLRVSNDTTVSGLAYLLNSGG